MSETLIFLYVITGGYNSSNEIHRRVSMPSLEACNQAVAAAKVHTPTHSDENENLAIVFCGGENMEFRGFDQGKGGAKWYPVKQ